MRPGDLTEDQRHRIGARYARGATIASLAREYDLHPKSLHGALVKWGVAKREERAAEPPPAPRPPPPARRLTGVESLAQTMAEAGVPEDQIRIRLLRLPPRWPVGDPYGMDPRSRRADR